MGRVRITRPFVLLALAALLAPRIEASRTSVWESNRPAALTATRADAAGQLASLAPAQRLDTSTAADSEIVDSPRFDLGDVVLVESALEHDERFGLGPLDPLGPTPLRGPPPSYPETRVRGFELLPPFRVGASPTLSLWPRQACGSISCELASDGPQDPWGLSFWSSIQGYVAGITEEADPTGLLPEVEAVDAGYHTGSRDAEDFDASKTAGKWTLRGLTALKAGAQAAGRLGIQAVKCALKSEAKQAATTFAAGVAGDVVEEAAESAGLSEDQARLLGRAARGAASAGASRLAAAGTTPGRRPVDPRTGRPRDPRSGRFEKDPDNPPSPYTFTDSQRRKNWRDIAADPNSPLSDAQRAEVKKRGWRGPQQVNPRTGAVETMELSHEPIPLREGGTAVVPRWPDDHARVDPHRRVKDGG